MYIPAGGGFWEAITGGIRAIASAQTLLDIVYASNVTTVKGNGATGDKLVLLANSVDTYPYIRLEGNGTMKFYTNTDDQILFYEGSTNFALLRALSNQYNFGIKETGSSPANVTGFGQLYTKSDNKLYFLDGDGTEHTVAFV